MLLLKGLAFRCDWSVTESAGLREFGLLADQTKLGAQPEFELVDDRRLFYWRTARRSSAVRPRISASMT